MDDPRGNAPPRGLDSRLLRFRGDNTAEDPVRLSEDLLGADRAVEAIEVAKIGLKTSPLDARLLVIEGRGWLKEGDLLNAQAALLRAARVAPNDKEPFRWLGEVLLKRGDPARAAKVLERAAAMEPNDRSVKMVLERAARLSRIAGSSEPPQGRTSAMPERRDSEGDTDMAETSVRPAPTRPTPSQPISQRVAPSLGSSSPVRSSLAPPARASSPERARVGDGPVFSARPGPVVTPAPIVATGTPRERSPFDDDDAMTAVASKGYPSGHDQPIAPWKPHDHDPEPLPAAAPSHSEWTPPWVAGAPDDEHEEPTSNVRIDDAVRVDRTFNPRPTFEEPRSEFQYLSGASTGGMDDPRQAFAPSPDEDPSRALELLSREKIFERARGPSAEWVEPDDAQRTGSRTGGLVAFAWFLALACAVGGYFGWQQWLAKRHDRAARLLRQAAEASANGDHESLVDAERYLRLSRDLDPKNPNVIEQLLMTQAQRALEEGAFEAGYLRPTVALAKRAKSRAAYVRIGEAVVAASEGDAKTASAALSSAAAMRGNDPMVLYLAGRLEQRLGSDAAVAHLERAAASPKAPVAATLALVEQRNDEGRKDEAEGLLKTLSQRVPTHLRTRLWIAFLTSDEANVEQALATTAGLERKLDRGAPTDRVLAALAKARLLQRRGDAKGASRAIDSALDAQASEPRLLALVAAEAKSLGKLSRAQSAAAGAVGGAPSNAEFRKLYADILLCRRDGSRALNVLSPLSTDDPDVLRMSAEGALQVGTEDALQAALVALDKRLSLPDAPIEMKALRIRARVALGKADEAFREAKELASQAPSDANVALALAEAAIASKDLAAAQRALEVVVRSASPAADAYFLLGQVKRMEGDAEAAEQSFRRALELSPDYAEARVTLGTLLLERGKYRGADDTFESLTRTARSAFGVSASVLGRSGRVLALVGLGRLEDAGAVVQSFRPAERETPRVRMAIARWELASGRAADAVATLAKSAGSEDRTADLLALYGDAQLAAGQLEPARESYDKALALDASNPEALIGRTVVDVEAGRSREALQRVPAAEAALQRRIRPPVRRAQLWLALGRARLAQGGPSVDAARTTLREAAALEGAPDEVYFWLGEALASANAEEARAAYQKYLERSPRGPLEARARKALQGL